MAQVFRTPEDQIDEVEIVGSGVVPPNGESGLPVDNVDLPELADVKEEDYAEALDEWAKSRGLIVEDATDKEIDEMNAKSAGVDLWAEGRAAYVTTFGVEEDAPERPPESYVDPTAPVQSDETPKAEARKVAETPRAAEAPKVAETHKADQGQKEDRK